MIHFRSKNDIIDWLEKNCPRRAIVRALREGKVELLGGFNPLSTTLSTAGWIVRVTSRFRAHWNVAIVPLHKPEIRILKNVLWENYLGHDAATLITNGDNPDQYRKFKDEAKKRMADPR